MSTHSYSVLLEPAQEDALHATRLLQVEERPFQRVTRNLLGKDSLFRWTPKQLPSPPPDAGDQGDGTNDTIAADDSLKRQRFREEILLDFAALESSLLRVQLTLSSNARERERYAAEKAKITQTAQAVRNSTLQLRAQVAEAQRMLELRKGYDVLAAKLIDSNKLKPRAETTEDIRRLEKEIEELRQESADYEGVWVGRREAFDRVVAEGQAMMRVVKGIKDEPEPEKAENVEDADAEDGEPSLKGGTSRLASPAPGEDGRTPMRGGDTPMPGTGTGNGTPLPGTPAPENEMLDVDAAGRLSSHAGTPVLEAQGGDVEMSEQEQPLPVSTERDEEQIPLEAQPKTTAAMEVTEDQVTTPAEGMQEDADQVQTSTGAHPQDEQAAIAVDDMDES